MYCLYNPSTGDYDYACTQKVAVCSIEEAYHLLEKNAFQKLEAYIAFMEYTESDLEDPFGLFRYTANSTDIYDRCSVSCDDGEIWDPDLNAGDGGCRDECVSGEEWDDEEGECVSICGDGEEWDDEVGECVCDEDAGYYGDAGSCELCDIENGYTLENNTCSPAVYTITYHLDGGTNFENAPETYTIESETITLGLPTKTDYKFDGWYNNENFEGEEIEEIESGSTGNKDLYAAWVPLHVLHIGDETLGLKTTKATVPSLNILIDGVVYYANATTTPTTINSETNRYLKTVYNDTIYYICDDTSYEEQDEVPNTNTYDKQSCSDSGGAWINDACVFN